MRLALGYSVLLALILGCLLSASSIRCFNYEDVNSDEQQNVASNGVVAAGIAGQLVATGSVPVALGAEDHFAASPIAPVSESTSIQSQEDEHRQAKRGMGMPAPVGTTVPNGETNVNSEEVSNTDNGQTQQQEAQAQQQVPQQPQQSTQESSDISKPVNEPNSSAPTTSVQNSDSNARGLGSDILSALSGSPPQSNPIEQLGANLKPQAPPIESLPTIIESGKSINPKDQAGYQQQASRQDKQLQQQTGQLQQAVNQAQTLSTTATNNNQLTGTNGSLPLSSARTFDSWSNCVGSTSNKYGICKNDIECSKNKGRADGSCMGGLGVCCVMALSCGDKSIENNTFYANPDFPEPSWDARLCEVEVKRKHKNILQVMIEFEEFELAPPNHEGECITDVFQVKLGGNRASPYSLLRICGHNTGQHLYLDVSQIDEPLVLSIATSGGGYPRRWSIRIVQMDDKNHLLAPPGCLQYYTDTVGHFRSFNMGRNLKNLYYAICFRIDNGYSGLRFTENFFGMNGHGCLRRLGRPGGPRHNSSVDAHPHHLVIPPPGYGVPPPRPKQQLQHHHQQQFQHPPQPQFVGGPQYGGQHLPPPPPPQQAYGGGYQQQGGPRYKRLAYIETGDRVPRTFHEHEHELVDKHDAGHHGHHSHHNPPHHHHQGGPPPPGYGPPPPPPGGYGYKPQVGYPQDVYQTKGEYKEDVKDKLVHDKLGHLEHEKSQTWKDKLSLTGAFGWRGAKDEFKPSYDNKYEHGYEQKHGAYQQPSGYGKYQQGNHHHQGGYGPPHYEGYGGNNKYGYGAEYHHKEIDKFGQKFEHLEYKHEKNHLGKHEHDKTSSGWWPFSGKKDEKKTKEKYFQHHEALFPMVHMPELPHCEPRFCGSNDVITFPPSGDSISEMCGNRFNRGRGPKIISGSPLVVYVSNRGHNRGAGFDMNYEQVFYIPHPY